MNFAKAAQIATLASYQNCREFLKVARGTNYWILGAEADEIFFWGTHGGAEMDLIVERGGKRYGFEFKITEKPGVTHSLTIAKASLELEKSLSRLFGRAIVSATGRDGDGGLCENSGVWVSVIRGILHDWRWFRNGKVGGRTDELSQSTGSLQNRTPRR